MQLKLSEFVLVLCTGIDSRHKGVTYLLMKLEYMFKSVACGCVEVMVHYVTSSAVKKLYWNTITGRCSMHVNMDYVKSRIGMLLHRQLMIHQLACATCVFDSTRVPTFWKFRELSKLGKSWKILLVVRNSDIFF